jgi:hypothetical protein
LSLPGFLPYRLVIIHLLWNNLGFLKLNAVVAYLIWLQPVRLIYNPKV